MKKNNGVLIIVQVRIMYGEYIFVALCSTHCTLFLTFARYTVYLIKNI